MASQGLLKIPMPPSAVCLRAAATAASASGGEPGIRRNISEGKGLICLNAGGTGVRKPEIK